MRTLALIGIVAWLAAGAAAAEEGPRKESSRRVERIGAGATLRVVNPFGNVYARFGGYENEVEILTTTQRIDAARPLELAVERGTDGLTLRVGTGSGLASGDRVDLAIFVPKGIAFDVETEDGAIEAKKLESDVVASTLSGAVRLQSVKGHVQAKSARGRIEATLVSDVTKRPQQLVTETGDIEVWIDEDARLNAELATSGEICTDFSIDIEHLSFDEPNKRGVAVVGHGGPSLRLTSKQGRVCLRRLQRDFRPRSDS